MSQALLLNCYGTYIDWRDKYHIERVWSILLPALEMPYLATWLTLVSYCV